MTITLLLLTGAGPVTQPAGPAEPGPATQAIKMAEFTSDEFQFRLKYPANWTVLDHPVNNQVFSLQTQPVNGADQHLGVVGLRIDSGPEDTPDGEILKDVSDGIVDYLFNHGGKKITMKPAKLGDYTARQVRLITQKPGSSTEVMYVIAVHKRTEYVFTIAAPPDDFEKMLPGVVKLLKSFELAD